VIDQVYSILDVYRNRVLKALSKFSRNFAQYLMAFAVCGSEKPFPVWRSPFLWLPEYCGKMPKPVWVVVWAGTGERVKVWINPVQAAASS
jgi:hypothetical protein